MAGGIRGIRALRVQRAAIEEQIAVAETNDDGGDQMEDRFARFGGKVAGQSAAATAEAEESK